MEQGTFISKKYNEDEFAKIVETEKEIEELKGKTRLLEVYSL